MAGFPLTGRAVALVGVVVVAMAGAGHAAAAPVYTMQSYPTNDVQVLHSFEDINASGAIVGQKIPGWPAPWATYANGVMTELPDSSQVSTAFINSLGDVAADVTVDTGNYALLWSGGVRTRISKLAAVTGINAKRQVIGQEAKGYKWPGMYDNGVYKRMASLNDRGAFPAAINDQGVVVGMQREAELSRPVMWDVDGNISYLGSLTDVGRGAASAINTAGHITGCTDVLGCFLYNGHKYRKLPKVDGHKVTSVVGLSDDDVVLGYSFTKLFKGDVVSCHGATYAFRALLGEEGTHWTSIALKRISPSGQIIGAGTRDGEQRNFVATMTQSCDAID